MRNNNDNENSNTKPETSARKRDSDNSDIPNLDVVAPDFDIATESFDPSKLPKEKSNA